MFAKIEQIKEQSYLSYDVYTIYIIVPLKAQQKGKKEKKTIVKCC